MAPKRAKSRLTPADKLKREIQAAFDEDLADERYRTGHGRYDGCGYVGAEAYFRLAGGEEAGLQPMQLTFRGKSRWWLLDPSSRVIDLALAPRETSAFPYHRGKPRRFRWTPAGISSAAQAIVDRVLAARPATPEE